LISFIILEFLEKKFHHKSKEILKKTNKIGPLVGGILGGFPQCGFSTMAASLFSNHVITMGSLVAIFLATSDEMLFIMLSKHVDFFFVLKVILFKVIVGIVVGFFIDLFYKKEIDTELIHDECEKNHCNCSKDGIFLSGFKHAFKISIFIFIMNILINMSISFIGENTLKRFFLEGTNIFSYFISSLIGLIPNCFSSIFITELYLSSFISIGVLISGLLTGSGVGILVLFRSNKNLKENLIVLSIIYFIGVFLGIMVDFII
ncbi:MAG: arsenic efflux protein, partial [Bacilli bacterium]|nr:arsenic efflux protein [Bacilli bacterium]